MSHRREKLVALAAELASDFATRAAEHDRNNSFPFENIARLKETGYSALVIPKANGGLGADLEDYVLCQEQLAQGCGATTIAINMHLFGLGSIVDRATGQRPEEKLFLDAIGYGKQIIGGGISEPETGGDWGYFATKARKDGDSYILNGRKTFTSLSPVIDLFMVMATIADSDPPRSSTFLIPKGSPGLELVETWDAMGMRATASHDLVIRDVVVPSIAVTESRPIGPIEESAVSLFAWFSLSVAAVYTGIAIAAFKFVKQFTGSFKPMAMPRPIKYLPGIQFAAADAQALLLQSRTFYVETAREYVANPKRFAGEGGLARVVLAKYIATNNAIRAVDLMMEIVGAHGYLKKFPMERYFRDVRAGVNHPFSNARARELIGKNALDIKLGELPRW